MKTVRLVLLTPIVALASLVIAELQHPNYLTADFNGKNSLLLPGGARIGADTPPPSPPPTVPIADDALWTKVSCRGHALLLAMTLKEDESSRMLGWPYTQSPWDGSELEKWGYTRDTGDEEDNYKHCNFAKYGMKPAFRELGVDTAPAEEGGNNHCFSVQHENHPSVKKLDNGMWPLVQDQYFLVDGVSYRATGGFARVGINVVDGIVYFLALLSPKLAAQESWGVATAPDAALPKIRSCSDLTWAYWTQVASGTNNLQNIKYFMSMRITNEETEKIVPRALIAVGVADGNPKLWPGTAFRVGAENEKEKEAADALMGSPNGLGAGYFLLQHKQQLGGAKYIWKIVVFRSESEDLTLLFYVGSEAPPQKRRADKAGEGHISVAVRSSVQGTGFVREHIFRALL